MFPLDLSEDDAQFARDLAFWIADTAMCDGPAWEPSITELYLDTIGGE
jgi:hypothetical protein